MNNTIEEESIARYNEEIGWLVCVLSGLRPVSMLEVGTMEGNSLKKFITGVPSIMRAVSVDIFYPQWDKRGTWHEWSRNAEIVTVQGDCLTQHIAKEVEKHSPFDFVFIDADHQYDNMKHDWTVYGGMCRAGGIVAFHDISPTEHFGFGGWKLWPEIKASHKTLDKIVSPECYWGGVGIVFK